MFSEDYKLKGANHHRDVAVLGPRGMVGRIYMYVGDHQILLYILNIQV